MSTPTLPDVGTDLTVEDLERQPKADGHEWDQDRVVAPRPYAEAGVPSCWLVERHPDDEWDGLVMVHRLTPVGYTVTRTIPLSELEDRA